MKKDMQKINDEIKKYENKIYLYEKQKLTNQKINMVIQSTHDLLTAPGEYGLSLDEKRKIIDKLIDEIHIEFGDDGEVKIKIVCILDELMNDIESRSQLQNVMLTPPLPLVVD
jgi:hypothetical protein